MEEKIQHGTGNLMERYTTPIVSTVVSTMNVISLSNQ